MARPVAAPGLGSSGCESGRLERGVFYKHDFAYGIGISGKPKVQVGDWWGPTAEIKRNGSDITVVANDYYDWTFRNCR